MRSFPLYFEKFNTTTYDVEVKPGIYVSYDLFKFWQRVILTDKLKTNPHFLKSIDISPDIRPDQISKDIYDNYNYHWTFFLTNEWLNNFYLDWPMSNDVLNNYLDDVYPGYAILLKKDIGDDLTPGRTVTNPLTNTSSKITHVNYEFNYIVVEDRNRFNAVDDLYSQSLTNYEIKEFMKHSQAPIEIIEKESDLRASFELYDDIKNALEPDYKIVTNESRVIENNEAKTNIKVIRPEYIKQTVEELIKLMKGDIIYGSSI